MTPEEARINLDACSLRPGDAEPEARALLSQNPELSKWIDKRTAFDEKAASAFAQKEVPEGLNDRLLAALMAEPVSASQTTSKTSRQPVLKSVWMPWLGLAAAMTIAFVALRWSNTAPEWRAEALAIADGLQGGTLPLDEFSGDLSHLKAFLANTKAPQPNEIPKELRSFSTLGCKVIVIGGRPASVVCFQIMKDNPAHLITFQASGLKDSPNGSEPQFSQHGNWQIATWRSGDQGYFLASKAPAKTLQELFTWIQSLGSLTRLV
ncbi:hypothetical protein [Prosthecobacter dejongeii]|uniref:Uncharacterized protein n=1 Tax=Prosthecobacter dejongeii TaxID=48465 RepID=A0A7W7YQR5_9BACT|nr:hypothetical protein [Prosthecobacter dejongeii]MBB5040484.1 hypothetical protein [Prosthecobacter dejongeii]